MPSGRTTRAGASVLGPDVAAEESRGGGARVVQSWIGVFIIFNILSLRIDLDVFDRATFAIPAALTVGVFVPVALLAIAALRGTPSRARQDLAVAAVVVTDMAIVLNSARIAPREHAETYLVLAAIIPLAAGLIVPMAFRHVAWLCGGCMVMLVLFVAAFHPHGIDQFGVPLLLAAVILVPVKLGHARERDQRLLAQLRQAERSKADALSDANARLTTLSRTDPLTGMANRRYFTERLTLAWDEACLRGSWLSVVIVDIDRFKLINDTAGHEAGDVALFRVAQVVEAVIASEGGLSARFGGEEFIAFIPSPTRRAPAEIGERIRRAVAELRLAHPGLPGGTVGVSVGATAAHGHVRHFGLGTRGLLRAADAALYAAKRAGRNRVVEIEPDLAPDADREPGALDPILHA